MAAKKKVDVQPESEVQEEAVVAEEQPVVQPEAPVEEAAPVESGEVAPAETEEVTVAEGEQKQSKGSKVGAAVKEWFRKRIVGLKRSPQTIVLVALFITTALWLIWLFTFSRTIAANSKADMCGLVVFINTLVSILIIALFGSAFPKRKKPNIVFIVLLFVFMAAIITCDALYYSQMSLYFKWRSNYSQADYDANPWYKQSLALAIAHIVLVGICAILLATLPLYKRLINKINTKKEVASNDMKEAIDVEED